LHDNSTQPSSQARPAQLSFLDAPRRPKIQRETLPHAPNSPTSKTAAENAAGRIGSKKRQIFDLIQVRGGYGATREEIANRLNFKESSACGAVDRLKKDGLIVVAAFTRESSCGENVEVLVSATIHRGDPAA